MIFLNETGAQLSLLEVIPFFMQSIRSAPVGRSLGACTRGGGGGGGGVTIITFEQTLRHGAIRPVPGALAGRRIDTWHGKPHLSLPL